MFNDVKVSSPSQFCTRQAPKTVRRGRRVDAEFYIHPVSMIMGLTFSVPFRLTHMFCFVVQFDISDLVRCMRLQRHGMVQTEVRLGLNGPVCFSFFVLLETGSVCEDQADHKIVILLPQPPECWDYWIGMVKWGFL
jgi:hypothetical protein